MVMIVMVTSCDLLAGLFGDDWEPDPEAVERPDAELSEQENSTVTIGFENLLDLDWFYMYNYTDEGELPEWVSVSGGADPYDTTYLKPERDNAEEDSTDPYEEAGPKADTTWRIDLGNTFDLTYEFKSPSNTTGYFGPNLSLRYDYDPHASIPEEDVVSVIFRKRPYETGIEPEYEFFVSHYQPDNTTSPDGFLGDYYHMDQLIPDTWYRIRVESRYLSNLDKTEVEAFLYDLTNDPDVPDLVASSVETFDIDGTKSFYNPSFWAYGDPDSAEPFSNRYIIGMMEASIPVL